MGAADTAMLSIGFFDFSLDTGAGTVLGRLCSLRPTVRVCVPTGARAARVEAVCGYCEERVERLAIKQQF